jgi:hypothetical protein
MTRVRRTQVQTLVKIGGEPEPSDGAGIPIAVGVKAFPIASRPIRVIGPNDEFWKVGDPDVISTLLATIVKTARNADAFVWLDPPAGVSGEVVEQALRSACVPVRYKPRQAVDAILTEAAVRTSVETSATMREVVGDLALEASAGLSLEDRNYLEEVLDVAMTGAGL